jgi:2-iminobutanoate/2-iminopropanoate deaminase
MEKRVIQTEMAPEPIGPYSQAVRSGAMLFVSGQIALKPGTNELNNTDIATETKQVMENIAAILQTAGLTFSHVVKTTIFLSDMAHFGVVNQVYGSYFSANYPARETVAVLGLPRQVNVEISVIAAG